MPKKYHPSLHSKPQSTSPASFKQSGSESANDGNPTSPLPSATTVNDLIGHLRIAQTSHVRIEDRSSNFTSQRSLPPDLRAILNVPETPPPKPRPGSRPSGLGRMRRTAGPPPPRSWLESSIHAPAYAKTKKNNVYIGISEFPDRPGIRLDILPGAEFPPSLSLEHVILKAMARNWKWHLENDGIYLSELPTLLKERLLSYVATFTPVINQDARVGLRVLFPRARDIDPSCDNLEEEYEEVTRLDLSSLMLSWPSRSALKKELLYSRKSRPSTAAIESTHSILNAQSKAPDSWEDASPDEEIESSPSSSPPTATPDLSLSMRFPNLAHLSLAQVAGKPSLVSWPDLLAIAPYLSTLTSLSLANWPVPTHTVREIASSMPLSAQSRNKVPPTYTGGNKLAMNFETDWAEAGSILRRLSKDLYCLKWLDLSGCTSWVAALTPQRATQTSDQLQGFDFAVAEQQRVESGPSWNGSWRNVVQIRFAANWIPKALTSEGVLAIDDWLKNEILRGKTLDKTDPEMLGQSSILDDPAPSRWSTVRSQQPNPVEPRKWANSRLADAWRNTDPATHGSTSTKETITQDWDVDHEREKYHQKKELEQFMRDLRSIRHVADHLRRLRLVTRGKFIDFEFGYDDA